MHLERSVTKLLPGVFLNTSSISRLFVYLFIRFDPEVIKLAEGSFGEVYEIAKSDFTERVLKVIPVGGKSPLDNEPHLTFKEVTTEVTTSK